MLFPERYQAHLPLLGEKGQKKLQESSILCVGAGGLASTCLPYLAGLGVGRIGIMDADTISLSNLQRQIFYMESDIGKFKAKVFSNRLKSFNSEIQISAFTEFLSEENAHLIENYDVVVDCCDNYSAKSLLHSAAFSLKKPSIYASVLGNKGHLSIFFPNSPPCYHCLSPLLLSLQNSSAPCSSLGVLGPIVGLFGCLQAQEAINILLKKESPLSGELLYYNGDESRFSTLQIKGDPFCSLCGSSKNSILSELKEISAKELDEKMINEEIFTLVDVRTLEEREVNSLQNSLFCPFEEFASFLPSLPKENSYVLYCQSGVRSLYAAEYLIQNGYSQVAHLLGGIQDWEERENQIIES